MMVKGEKEVDKGHGVKRMMVYDQCHVLCIVYDRTWIIFIARNEARISGDLSLQSVLGHSVKILVSFSAAF